MRWRHWTSQLCWWQLKVVDTPLFLVLHSVTSQRLPAVSHGETIYATETGKWWMHDWLSYLYIFNSIFIDFFFQRAGLPGHPWSASHRLKEKLTPPTWGTQLSICSLGQITWLCGQVPFRVLGKKASKACLFQQVCSLLCYISTWRFSLPDPRQLFLQAPLAFMELSGSMRQVWKPQTIKPSSCFLPALAPLLSPHFLTTCNSSLS